MRAGAKRGDLIARVGQMRRLAATRPDPPDRGPAATQPDPPDPGDDWQKERIRALEARVAHLEHMVEGLQDSVHRESDRHDKLLDEIQAQIQPAQLQPALAEHARLNGI